MKRPRGTGHVFKPSKNWAISYYDPHRYGARKEYGFRTQQAAERRLAEVMGNRNSGRPVPPPPELEEAGVLRWGTFAALNPAEAAGPIVYAWARRDVVLYVGKSEHGLSRPFDAQHHRLGKALLPTDQILVLPCLSPEEAARIELRLIHAIRPPANARP